MKTMKEMTVMLLTAAAVILAGCVTTSVYPFYGENDAVFGFLEKVGVWC
jgi:hypothetical protein